MNAHRLQPGPRTRASAILLVAVALSATLVAAVVAPAAAYDPARPTSSTGKGGNTPPGGGDPGGGGGPARKVALGVARPPVSDVDTFTAEVGKKPAIWVLWNQWGNPSRRDFPTAEVNELKARNVQPMIWWEPVDPANQSDPTYPRHKNITAGNHDAYIRQWARDAKAFGSTVLVRFAHEINNNYFPWSVNEFDNSPATFIDAWRHVVSIFRAEGATNVKWVWSIAKKACSGGCNPYTEVYPGDAWVDIMAFSAYNWGTHDGKSWTSMYDSYRRVTMLLRDISDKPIMVAETASNSEGGYKPAWIRDGYREVYDRLPDIEAIVYLDADLRDVGHPDWRIASPPAALDAYAEIAGLARFDTRSPFGKRLDTKARLGDHHKAAKKRTKKDRTTAKQPAAKKRTPKVSKGSNVDSKSRDSQVGKTRNKIVRKKKKSKPQPIEVLDTFSR